MQAGKAIVVVFAAIIIAAALLFVAYKARESGEPPLSMRFERVPPPANATVHELEYKSVHAALYLQDHLDTARDQGQSTEDLRLRVLSLRDTLNGLTGSAGPEWWVDWEGATVHIVMASPAP